MTMHPSGLRRLRRGPGRAARGLLAAAWLLALGAAAPARADGDSGGGAADWLSFQSNLQVLGYGTQTVLNHASLVNPGNRVAAISESRAEIDPRLDLTFKAKPCFLQLKPRGFFVWQSGTPASAGYGSAEAYLNEGRLSCRVSGSVNAEAGRGVLLWGSAILLSPSNPFFAETGKTDPVRELLGRDFVRVTAQLAPAWSIEGIRNFHVDTRDAAKPYFSPVGALKLNWTGEAAQASVLVSHRDNGVNRLGAYGTWTASNALLLYADGSLGQGNNALFAVPQPGAPGGWGFVQNQTGAGGVRASALLGASYTLASGWTQTLELLYNGDGYTSGERQAYQQAIRAGNAALATGNPAAAGLLGQALNLQQNLFGRRYALYQLNRTDLFNKLDVTLRYTQAFDAPRGGNVALSLNYKLGLSTEWFAFAQWNVGNPQSEFVQLSRFSIMSGLRYYWY
ncbi:hypothetical protein Bsp3421_000392 (plasmid) [Burkholderia sp. FERM BP-3421]|uniref:hypothetical protein n=1 Tax=Burkholderia sp. FERM BP-3421 TaxID=1494466 RepID=UPI002361C4F3|nr:hypothetical protein [Burkholderia sp. FERM BP-3421]WDD90534.1 hypothetical protein Bsp3421_000392 [Burkholderia sp. FERM BP-3421]